MTTYIITRHMGSVQWIKNNLPNPQDKTIVQPHLDPNIIHPGDMVIGVLPLHIIADIGTKGADFYSLDITCPPELRGRELDLQTLEDLHPKLTKYRVTKES